MDGETRFSAHSIIRNDDSQRFLKIPRDKRSESTKELFWLHFGMKYYNAKKGFTLIEILVVVTIIGILASITLLGLGPARRSAQDARRIADIRQMQTALEVFYNRCGKYPPVVPSADTVAAAQTAYTTMAGGSAAGCTGLELSNVPNDANPAKLYGYAAATGSNGDRYIIGALLDVATPQGYNNPSYTGFSGMNSAATGYCYVTAGRVPYCVASP